MNDYDNYYDARQHLNLSQIAYDVIDQDRYIFFEKPSFTKMLNRIFETYREYADASVDLACENYEQALQIRLAEIPDSTEKSAIIKELVSDHRKSLIEKVRSYPREFPFKVQLNRENYAFISEWRDPENVYKGVAGHYIKAVIEEYSRKPLVDREEIILGDMIDAINHSIEAHRVMSITLSNGKRYEIKAYCVCKDQGNNYHYLAGYSKQVGTDYDEKPASFRISNIREYRITGKSGHLSETQRKEIKNKIRSVGVQFLLQDPEKIIIRFTKSGKKMYDSQAHLRPIFVNRRENADGSWTYEFNCTQLQAQYYFFKFGAKAEVLCPPDLRILFADEHLKASNLYNLPLTIDGNKSEF